MGIFKFDEIAFNSTEKKKPVDEDKYTYLGLEHLDSDSIYVTRYGACLLYTSPSPRDVEESRMPSSA